jgi:hypothetical protein
MNKNLFPHLICYLIINSSITSLSLNRNKPTILLIKIIKEQYPIINSPISITYKSITTTILIQTKSTITLTLIQHNPTISTPPQPSPTATSHKPTTNSLLKHKIKEY